MELVAERRVKAVNEINKDFMIITTPNVDISTAEAYSELNVRRLTKSDSKSILQNCYEEAERLKSMQINLINDFEISVFKIKPEIKRTKEKLLDLGATQASMSGSGASVFWRI